MGRTLRRPAFPPASGRKRCTEMHGFARFWPGGRVQRCREMSRIVALCRSAGQMRKTNPIVPSCGRSFAGPAPGSHATFAVMGPFVSRAGQKLEHAIAAFGIDVAGRVCADLGSNTGGFTDCMLQRGAARVYAIDTGYGVLEWKLRKDPRVVVMERTNAMHVVLPEPVGVVTIDVAWTRQHHILPAARRLVAPDGFVVTLLKPHYVADSSQLVKGRLP